MKTSCGGSRLPAVNSSSIDTFHRNEYLETTKAVTDPKSNVRNTAGAVMINEFHR
jgi:hypothetical protein